MKKWQLEALDFQVKAIETFLGLKFEGKSIEEKQTFVSEHKDKRTEITSELLRESYLDMNNSIQNKRSEQR